MIDVEYLKKHMYDVISAIHEVHQELGPGLLENVYQEGLMLELQERHIPFSRELSFHPTYHGKAMQTVYRLDFLCKGDIIIELKAVDKLTHDNRSQLFNYMRLVKCQVGILVNFAPRFAEIETYLYDSEAKEILSRDGRRLIRSF